ncbi:MAG: sensor histidine kinase [Actinomycetaceae bacterium]|nr:sensor histidine kinase [Arcanobacterium sp.]MDD7505622.1 sensor histidine kinase [Actinomycetaceae bacterium]MDY6143400.1 sensor histidine kinase [Arcanobacterium sp.]
MPLDAFSLLQDTLLAVSVCAIVVSTAFRRTHVTISAAGVYLGLLIRFLVLPSVLLYLDFALLFALYACVAYGAKRTRRIAIIAALIAGIAYWSPFLTDGLTITVFYLLVLIEVTVLVVYAFGLVRRYQFRRVDDAMAASEMRARQLERETKAAVVEERNRIAREMHDIVAHTLTVIIAQADGGRYAAHAQPEGAEQALATISDVARSALRDVRSIIGVLRDPSDSDSAPLLPQADSHDLTMLIEQVRDAGANVIYEQRGEAQTMPPAVSNALYRICQEALTNSLKYAGENATIWVTQIFVPGAVSLSVVDDGAGAHVPPDGFGHGIIGMRERASILGGITKIGAMADGGFQVRVTIPLTQPEHI